MVPSDLSPFFVAYALGYGLAAVGCGVALLRARTVEDPGTRRGLVGLLAGSGGWALFEFGFLVAPTPDLAYAAYLASLVVGFTTIGAWLYFASAYTGRAFHRDRTYRRAAVGTYLAVVALKVTNPLHELYFTTDLVAAPFPHLAVSHGTIHWVVTGLSYALAAVGFFMVYELFLEADYDTRPLAAVVAATGLPVALDLVGFATPLLLDVNYEPLGVVVFAVGALFVFEDRFLAVQLTAGVDEPVVYLDDAGRIREFNDRARDLFPALRGAVGEPFAAVLPEAAARADQEGEAVLERRRDGERRYYLVSGTAFTLGQTDIGRLVVFADVTETERRRRELRRHNEQLEGFAAAIRHELLNTLQLIDGWVTAAGEALEDGDLSRARDALTTAAGATDRSAEAIGDLAELARYGRTPRETAEMEFEPLVRAAFEAADVGDLDLAVEGAGELEANGPRTQDLLENAFEFAEHNGASTVTAELREDGFAVAGDGEPPGELDTEDFFAYGESVPDSEAGMALPSVRTFARTQGWDAEIDDGYDDGVRVVVSGVPVERARRATA